MGWRITARLWAARPARGMDGHLQGWNEEIPCELPGHSNSELKNIEGFARICETELSRTFVEVLCNSGDRLRPRGLLDGRFDLVCHSLGLGEKQRNTR